VSARLTGPPLLPVPISTAGSQRRKSRIGDIVDQVSSDDSGSLRSAPLAAAEDLAAIHRLQDKYNREDEAALAKQEAFAREVQADLNRASTSDKSSYSQRQLQLSTQKDHSSRSTPAGVITASSLVHSQWSLEGSNSDEPRPLKPKPLLVSGPRSVVVKPPTITNSALTGIKRPKGEAITQTAETSTIMPRHFPSIMDARAADTASQGKISGKESAEKKLTTSQITMQVSPAPEKVACTACDDRDLPSAMASLPCGHQYCAICIADAFKHALAAGKVFICCKKTPCPVAVAERFLPSEFVVQYKLKLEERTAKEPVYCAKPGCSAFISPKNMKGPLATCQQCGFVSCSLCKNPEHNGICPPDRMGKKLMSLADNQNWIQCKRCKAIVERDEGCMHMTCMCGYEFCYKCGGPWAGCKAKCKGRR
jgi:hypothetical protein